MKFSCVLQKATLAAICAATLHSSVYAVGRWASTVKLTDGASAAASELLQKNFYTNQIDALLGARNYAFILDIIRSEGIGEDQEFLKNVVLPHALAKVKQGYTFMANAYIEALYQLRTDLTPEMKTNFLFCRNVVFGAASIASVAAMKEKLVSEQLRRKMPQHLFDVYNSIKGTEFKGYMYRDAAAAYEKYVQTMKKAGVRSFDWLLNVKKVTLGSGIELAETVNMPTDKARMYALKGIKSRLAKRLGLTLGSYDKTTPVVALANEKGELKSYAISKDEHGKDVLVAIADAVGDLYSVASIDKHQEEHMQLPSKEKAKLEKRLLLPSVGLVLSADTIKHYIEKGHEAAMTVIAQEQAGHPITWTEKFFG